MGDYPGSHADAPGSGRRGQARQVRSLSTNPSAKTVNEDLLDCYLEDPHPLFRLYEPDQTCIVMGAGGKAAEDVFTGRAEADGVPLLRRRGGGGTVVLSPGQVVLALVSEVDSPFQNRAYFHTINHWFRLALQPLGVSGIEDRGISDLAIREKKILGTSLYRRRRVLFYQASLLVENDLSLFDRYLGFPSKVPDYRMGRAHRAFCTTLRTEGYTFSVQQVMASLDRVVSERLDRLS